MIKRKHSVEQIIGPLREAEVELAQGLSVAEACRSVGGDRADLLALAK